MKRLIIYLIILLGSQPLGLWAQTYVEITDSTSTEWTDDENSGGFTPATPSGPVKSLVLSQTAITLSGGHCVRLVATVNNDAANKNITWASSNPAVATVSDNGVVWALTIGTTIITATAVDNTNINELCVVTVTSNYEGMKLPNIPFEFFYSAADYNTTTQSIPNHPAANLANYALRLSGNTPIQINDTLLRFADYCEGYIDRWDKSSTESGAYFYRKGQDCMTIVAKVAPKLNTNNTCDFVTNRGANHNYMWRIGDQNKSFLHTSNSIQDERTLSLNSEDPQILAVRVDGLNDKIFLQNLTTGDRKQIDGIHWGGENNVFKLFYNDGSEFFLGDFYWVYYSFELLTDLQLKMFSENVLNGDVDGDGVIDLADAVLVINHYVGKLVTNFIEKAADVDGDGVIDLADAVLIINYYVGKIPSLARETEETGQEPQ